MRIKASGLALTALFALMQGLTCSAEAQVFTEAYDWKESEVPPPPAFDLGKLMPIDVSGGASLVYGVDPASVSISRSDSLVRYVMVASSASGGRNVLYEAIRCSTGEFKTYARHTSDGRWQAVTNPQWRSVFGNMPSKHALAFAKAGACDGAAPAGTVPELVNKLKNQHRYLDQ